MTDRDLTPAEARAEVEAFMGEGWVAFDERHGDAWQMSARRLGGTTFVHGLGWSLRAAVDALKAAWRDAVRPWVVEAVTQGACNIDDDGSLIESEPAIVARVLGEDAK